jgi:hypothetical protein
MSCCPYTCLLAGVFIISMIYFHVVTIHVTPVVQEYKKSLPLHLQSIYNEISHERMKISLQGYALGFLLSAMVILYYKMSSKKSMLTPTTLVCLVITITFITNYFYYILSPKRDWMLNHIKSHAENANWLNMYRKMQFHYHLGLVLGIIGVGIFAFAFR